MYYNSSSNQAKVCLGGSWAAMGVPTVTSLPASPADGDEVYYRVSNLGNGNAGYWHLRYNASTTYWDFLGGPSLESYDGSSVSNTTTNYYGSNAWITAPLTMDLEVHYGVAMVQSQYNGLQSENVALYMNGVRTSVVTAVGSNMWDQTALYGGGGQMYSVGSGQAIRTYYASGISGQQADFTGLFVEVTPIRVK